MTLALRVAQEYTGGTGIIVSREAYHGTSALTSGCSPALGSEQPLLPNVRLIETPDYYRHGGTPEEFTAWYSGEMQKKIDELGVQQDISSHASLQILYSHQMEYIRIRSVSWRRPSMWYIRMAVYS